MEIWKQVQQMNQSGAHDLNRVPLWSPVLGVEFNRYVARLPEDQQKRLTAETHRILSACVDPSKAIHEPRANAGLVLGYVQSGKTSSFTAATALAHDNGFKLIIIVGGVSTILLSQTFDRLQDYLDLDHADVVNRWTTVRNPKLDTDPAVQQVQHLLTRHGQRLRAGEQPVGSTPIIVVMKETSHLRNLNSLLKSLAGPDKQGLVGIPALVIDDECHMATPNVAKGDDNKSRIYELMGEMRSYLPHHSLLQYTATPQANLLCEVEDEFRPDFVRLLGHGEAYAGGSAFFLEEPRGRTIMRIPPDEQAHAKAATPEDMSVPSLRRALATYLLIAANDYRTKILDGSHQFDRFSMLVHADAKVGVHQVFHSWLTSLRSSWLSLIQQPVDSIDRLELLAEEFEPAYQDLAETTKRPFHPLEELFSTPMEEVLGLLQIWRVDGSKGGTRKPDFSISNYNVLNGGELLGVGFTVPRLHVTHMVRNAGQGQMDTIQQRGRFFGYCRPYLDKVRVWLEDDVRKAFEGYVEEEEYLRRDLKEFDEENRPLREWKVRLRLDPRARPTRRSAIRRDIKRFKTNEGWISQSHWLANGESKSLNLALVQDFLGGVGVFKSVGQPALDLILANQEFRGGEALTQHFQTVSGLGAVRRLIADFAVDARDRDNFIVGLETLDEIAVNSSLTNSALDEEVDVFLMAHGAQPKRRRRAIGVDNHQVDLFQGRNENYRGDRAVHTSRLSLQIHLLDHGPSEHQIDESNVVYIALWLPDKPRAWAEKWIQEA